MCFVSLVTGRHPKQQENLSEQHVTIEFLIFIHHDLQPINFRPASTSMVDGGVWSEAIIEVKPPPGVVLRVEQWSGVSVELLVRYRLDISADCASTFSSAYQQSESGTGPSNRQKTSAKDVGRWNRRKQIGDLKHAVATAPTVSSETTFGHLSVVHGVRGPSWRQMVRVRA